MRQSYRSYALVMPKLYLHIRFTYAKIILIPQFHDILPYFFTMVGYVIFMLAGWKLREWL